MTNLPGQIDIFEMIRKPADNKERKVIDAASGQTDRVMLKWPAELSEWYEDHSTDWWYGEEECIGCRQVEARKALTIGHGVQFDEDGKQYLPGGPRMAEHGVCMLMSFVAMHAYFARMLAEQNPQFAEWRRQCHKHEHPTKRKKCPQSHFAEEAEYRARLATKVWGSEAWRERDWT